MSISPLLLASPLYFYVLNVRNPELELERLGGEQAHEIDFIKRATPPQRSTTNTPARSLAVAATFAAKSDVSS